MTAATTKSLLDPAGRELMRGLTACGWRQRLFKDPEPTDMGGGGGGV